MKEFFKDTKKRNLTLTIIISLILVIISSTLAYFNWESTDNPLVDITVSEFADVIFKGGNDISVTNIGPVLDYNDGEITEFTIKKRIEDELPLVITVKPTTLPENLKHESFKVKILTSSDNQTYTEVGEINFKDKQINRTYPLLETNITDNNIKYYKVIFYIDGHVFNPTAMQGQTFAATIGVKVGGCDKVTVNGDNSVNYAGAKWYKISEDSSSYTLVLAENYGTGDYGNYTTITDAYWSTSRIKTQLDEYLSNSGIDTQCLVKDAKYGYVRAPYQSELSASIPNDSNTPFWTMNYFDNYYVVVGKADGTLYEGWNDIDDDKVKTAVLWGGSAYSSGPHGTASSGQSFVWDRYAVTSRSYGPLRFNPYGSAYNYNLTSTVYVGSGGTEKTIEDNIDCYDSTKGYWSYSWYTSSYSNSTGRVTANVCTEAGPKTVYLCQSVACCKYGSKYSSQSGGSSSYSYKDFTYNTYTSCTAKTEYKYTQVTEDIGYRPVIQVYK